MMNKTSRGFTLIELLISITILSALLYTGSFTYSLFAQRWQKDIGQFNQSLELVKNVQHLQSVLQGIAPMVVLDNENDRKQPVFFFVGKDESLLATTRNGLFTTDDIEIFRLSVIEDENNNLQLLYQAASGAENMLVDVAQTINFDQQIVLLDDISQFSFKYYGHANYNAIDPNVAQTWQKSYSGIDQLLMPSKMQVSAQSTVWGRLNFKVELNDKVYRMMYQYLSEDDDE